MFVQAKNRLTKKAGYSSYNKNTDFSLNEIFRSYLPNTAWHLQVLLP
ncbi:30507_t:CDS:2 [Gigaspora margarita]|uniref:30507_t:CDS:1 n=1 Tax=Gigaspora margarita TaxID=4874 RepID=A0ABN7UG64_GIGMA|nr:30507_t:CDS:2 [Gigaspora margarita]